MATPGRAWAAPRKSGVPDVACRVRKRQTLTRAAARSPNIVFTTSLSIVNKGTSPILSHGPHLDSYCCWSLLSELIAVHHVEKVDIASF